MKKILCPVDFSEVSINAIEFAAKLGDAYHSSLTLINVITEKEYNQLLDSESVSEEFQNKVSEIEGKLENLCSEVIKSEKRKGLLECNKLVKSGKFTSNILDTAKEQHYELIVMGTTGVTNLKEKYIGSRTMKIIEDAPCSVLVIPSDVNFHKIKSIVYATDYQEEDKIAIQIVVALATMLQAKIDIIHVSQSDSDSNKALYEEFTSEMKSFINYNKLRFQRRVFSSTAKGLKSVMHEEGADLLILLNKKRNFFSQLFHHSVTKDLYEFSDFPFMVINL